MKGLFALLFLMLMIYSCSKDSSDPTFEKKTQLVKGMPIGFKTQAVKGTEGGRTSYRKSENELSGKDIDSSFFISQYPLLEYRYIQEVSYDSIPTYEIDTDTKDTLSISYVIEEVSRDTIGFEKDILWLPLDDRNFSQIYVGVSEEQLVGANFIIQMEMIDTIPVEGNGLLFMWLENLEDPLMETVPILSSTQTFDSRYFEVTDEIPVYNDKGEVVDYKHGIKLGRFGIRHFQIGDNTEITRSFRLSIATQPDIGVTPEDPPGSEPTNDFKVFSDFQIKFVMKDVWEQRQCWLSGDPACQDLF